MSDHKHEQRIDFQQLLSLSGDAVIVRDAEDRILFWNRGAEELYGYTAEEATGRASGELLRTQCEQASETIAQELQARGRWAGRLARMRRDGRRVALRSAWTCSLDGPQARVLILESSSELLERDTAREGPASERQALEALIRTLPVGVVMMSAGGEMLSMNEAAMRLYDFASPQQILPQLQHYIEQFELCRPDGTRLPPDARPAPRALRGEFVRACEVVLRETSTGTEHRVVCSAVPVPLPPGQERLYLFVLQDVTERRRSEAALRQADERLRENQRRLDAILANASVAIFVMDERYHCAYMNAAAQRLSGYTLEEMAGRALHDVVHHTRPDGSHLPIEECPIGRSLPGNDQARGEEVFVHKDGTFYPVAFNAAPIRDEDGSIIGTILEVRDIRQEKETLEALREAHRAKDEFLAMLGHELRNPLSPIVTCLHLMRLRGVQSRELAVIERQVEHLTRLVDDLLDVSRVTRGLIELRSARVEVAGIVARSVEIARPMLEQREQRLVLDVADAGLCVEADSARLAQVFSNLLVNASKFSPWRSTVTLRAWQEAGSVRVSVKDEGQGIPAEMLERIFEPFVQDAQGKDRRKGGLGLGLAITRTLVELHQGRVLARSDGPGRGAEFLVTLPQAGGDGLPDIAAAPDLRRVAGGGRRILLVDDNRDVAETMKSFLEDEGHTVLALFDAASALEQAAGFAPDVAILDIGLPVMDGYELASRLREVLAAGAALRLIALSGYGLPRDREQAARAGFDLHLVKPADTASLLAAIG